MKIMRAILLSLLGVALPVAVALGVYTVSARSFDAETPFVAVGRIARPLTPPPSPSLSPLPTPYETASPDDRGDRCSEPEHANDPECLAGGGGDSSGSGSGDSGSGSDNSGPGSGNSGSGSDNSGPGSRDD